jgi:hypothetical protein
MTSGFDEDDDFEEAPVVKTYKEEGTPAIFSSRTSLSGLTFTDDERDDAIRKEKEPPAVSFEDICDQGTLTEGKGLVQLTLC